MKPLLGHLLWISSLLMPAAALAVATPGDPAPAFRANDAAGQSHTLTDYIGNWIVLEWFHPGCEAVENHYDSGNLPRLQERYREQGVKWLTIISSAPGPDNVIEAEEALALEDTHDLRSSAPVLLDDTSVVARAYGVSKAPQIYIIDPHGTLVYSGAPDDSDGASPEAIEAATSHIEAALEAGLAGEAVETPRTEAYGCELDLDI
ncbi:MULTISPECIES: redoxin domain-containing protein [Marinimicrobium]|uniref:Peroxiredoxin n=1 Tax=Marinimicrobium koreense TaxID=306545 RepID=A0A3N1NK48_9GAMM|nr:MULTISPECIES: redoxin domain-containing protein [Marinimicrobium]ROQ20184.1 peroxiredoxin [Marinimicrobium koreense]